MEKYDYKKESLDELIYRDSSLFLKVMTKIVKNVSCWFQNTLFSSKVKAI